MGDERTFLAKIHAEQFQAAFERCWNAERSHDRIPEVPLGVPAIVCAALSVEIGLKALLLDSGIRPKREHNLERLLNALPKAIQLAIVEEVSVAYPDFACQLANAAEAFVQWRYFYDARQELNVNALFLGALGAAVQRQIGTEWAEG